MDNTWFEKMEERIPRGEVRTRFAPSPTGYMHVGNLRTALYTWCIARHAHGKFLLRIEDTDQSRQVEGAVEVIYKTLRDCGLDHDEGPDVGGPVGPYVQTERRDTYLPYAKRLVERGHAYYCFCDKTESEEDSGDFTRKDDPCRDLSAEEVQRRLDAGMPWVIRQKIPHEGETTFHDEIFGDITAPNADLDDQVLIKRDGLPTYNFANVIDDHLMGITHVVRGSEYLSSAPKYNLLYEGLGWDVPSYVHCSPVMRDAHNKMSKRHGDPSYEDLVAQGFLTEAIVNYVALLGWAPGGEREIFSINELAEAFDMSRISKSPAIFDIEKLTYFNSEYIKAMSPEAFARAAEPWIRKAVKTESYDPALIAAILQQRKALGHSRKARLLRYAARVRHRALRPQEVQVRRDRRARHAQENAPASRGHHRLDGGGRARLPDRRGGGIRLQKRSRHVAGAHRRFRRGRDARRRRGDLPYPRPDRNARAHRQGHRKAGKMTK